MASRAQPAGRWAVGLMLLVVMTSSGLARGAPDLGGAVTTLATAPLDAAGDIAGGAGLIGAAALGLGGDGVALIDGNRFTAPVLGGAASGTIQRVAMALSWTATGLLEGLRGEDIERLPEAPATYLEAAPGFGRFDTFTVGVRAIVLSVHDLLLALPLAGAELLGAEQTAERLRTRREEARIDALGPVPEPSSP